jgi:hypothetical protein
MDLAFGLIEMHKTQNLMIFSQVALREARLPTPTSTDQPPILMHSLSRRARRREVLIHQHLLKLQNGTFGRRYIRINPSGFINSHFNNRDIGPDYEKRNNPT